MAKITSSNINADNFYLINDKQEINFVGENGQEGTHYRYPAGYDFGEGVKGAVLYEGGGVTEPTKKDPRANCLRMTLYRNKFRKTYEKDVEKVVGGKKTTVKEKVLAGAPYTISISPRDKNDEEFAAFVKGTATLREGLIKALLKSPAYKDQGYDGIISLKDDTPESIDMAARACGTNVARDICAHPLLPKNTIKRDTSKPKTANFEVYDGTSIAVPRGIDNNGDPILKDYDKEKLVNAEGNGRDYTVDLYGYPLIKFHKVHLGNGKVSIKSYIKSIIFVEVKKRETQSFQNDTALKNMSSVDANIDDALAKLESQFDQNKSVPKSTDSTAKSLTNTNTKPKTKPVVQTENKKTAPPSTGGDMMTTVKKTDLPKGALNVDFKGMEEFE